MSVRESGKRDPTAYEVLAVHPTAPGELLSTAYWMAVEEIQKEREAGRRVDAALHLVTRAYERVSTPEVRSGYNLAIGQTAEPLTRRSPEKVGWGPFRRRKPFDYYEVLGLHETAPPELVPEAVRVMESIYLRAPMPQRRRRELLAVLDVARVTLLDPGQRARYDARRRQAGPDVAAGPLGVLGLLSGLWRLVAGGRRSVQPLPSVFDRLTRYLESAPEPGS